MCFSHLGIFLISVKPLTTENTENKTTPKICKITCVRWERERERRKWRHPSSAKIGNKFALSLAKNLHFRSSPPQWRWVQTFCCQQFALFVKIALFVLPLSEMARKVRTEQAIECSAAPSFPSKKWIKLIQKTIGNRNRDCAWGCARGAHETPPEKVCRSQSIFIRKAFVSLTGLVCALRSADFLGWCLSPECNLTHCFPVSVSNSFLILARCTFSERT